MEEITLTGGTLMGSANSPAKLSGGGSGAHVHNSGCQKPNCCDNGPSEMEMMQVPSPSLDELVKAPKEEICRALSTLFRFGRFEALEPLLNKLQDSNESVSFVFELLKESDEGGHSLLHWSAKRTDDIRFLQLVIDVTVVQFHDKDFLNVASSDNVGMRPLHWACTEGSIPHVALLLKHGADMEAKDSSGCTPLLIAAQYGQVETVAYLLQKGANGQAVDTAWDTALHWAAYKGSTQVCGVLSFYQDLDWAMTDAYGQSPLHLASLRGHTSVVRYILLHLKQPGVAGGSKKYRDILFLKDKNQRTPLDLAVHKNRPTVEAVLREAMAADKDPRGYFFRKTMWTSLKEFGSWNSWKTWLGMVQNNDEVDEPMKGPYYFVLANFTLHFLFMFALFCPVFSVSSGLMWDKSGWLFWNAVLMVATWYTFYKTVNTSPGYLDDSHKDISIWRKLYEQTLEAYAAEDANLNKLMTETPLCHTCHVARPLRSKYCRITRKVVLMFDHHCPFVNNTIGLYNYSWFYFFLTFMSLGIMSFIVTFIMYLRRYAKAGNSFPWFVLLLGLELSFTAFPIVGMWIYHTQLTMVNLTTNEHLNIRKYKYLYKSHQGKKMYKNPWFKGWFGNAMERLFYPGEGLYMIPKDREELLASPSSTPGQPGDIV